MVTTKLVATIVCDSEEADGSGCTESARFERDAESCSLEQFSRDAADHFSAAGWRLFGGHKCPTCCAMADEYSRDPAAVSA